MALVDNPSDEFKSTWGLSHGLGESVTMSRHETVQNQGPSPEEVLGITRTGRMKLVCARIKDTSAKGLGPRFGEIFINAAPILEEIVFTAPIGGGNKKHSVQTKRLHGGS